MYAIYLYADDLMQWASKGGGIGGYPRAYVGYYHIQDYYSFSVPGSYSCSIIHIASRSNVGIPGMFVLHLNRSYPFFGK